MVVFNKEKLKELRTGRGLIQEHLAADLDVSSTQICKLESGKIPNTNMLLCWKLAKFFSVPMETFVKEV